MPRRLGALVAAMAVVSAALTVTANANAAGPAAVTAAKKAAAAVVPNGAWTTYHHDNARTGYDASAPAVQGAAPTTGWTTPALDDEIYAEPLIYNGVVYVATLNDTVYALNQTDGSVIWSNHLGTPQTGGWQCGNISPTGILGTPVIDTSANRLYAVAEVVISNVTSYHLFGLDLGGAGAVVLNSTLTTSGFDWTIEQQRGALAVLGGYIDIPFGGRAGDCGPYHGYVFTVNGSTGAVGTPYATPGIGMGIWSAGGVVIDDTTGNLFVSTGNATTFNGTDYCAANSNGTPRYENDAVVRLAPITLAHMDAFIPADWQANWCENDQDVGSIAPVLLSPTLMFQTGKWGNGFLLDPNHLGGTDGQAFPTPSPQAYAPANTCFGNNGDATFGSQAYAAPFVYLECEGNGIAAINVNTGAHTFSPCDTCASPDWHAGGSITFGPPIVAGGAVWAADWSGGTGLYAFNQTTGALIYHSASFGINRFVAPAEAGGQVFVPSHNVVLSFTFSGTVTVTPSSVDFGGQAPGTTSGAQTVTFHNNTPATVNVTTASVTGANAARYAKGSDTCSGQAIATGTTCAVQVTFHPAGYGGLPAALTFTYTGAANSPQNVALNGEGALDDSTHLYTLDGYGGLHADNGSPAMSPGTYWRNLNIARSAALFPDGTGGYVLDGYGGLHPFGSAPAAAGNPYWAGWDIARQVVLAPWSSAAAPAGWVLDGFGGVHPFNGAPAINGSPYFGKDLARGIAILPDSTASAVAGYVLDGYGSVHPFGGAPAIGNAPHWSGWDIARGLTLSPDASRSNAGGWIVDGYGGIHPFGTAPALAGTSYFGGFDIARGILAWTGNGPATGGWVLDGYGGIHPFGSAPGVSGYPYWYGWDIATSLGGSAVSTGSRRRT